MNHLGSSNLVHAQSFLAILARQVVLMGAVEAYRVHSGALREDIDLPHPSEALDPWGLAGELWLSRRQRRLGTGVWLCLSSLATRSPPL